MAQPLNRSTATRDSDITRPRSRPSTVRAGYRSLSPSLARPLGRPPSSIRGAGCWAEGSSPRPGRSPALIDTARLGIRLPEMADVPEIIRYYGENRAHLQPFSPTFAPDFLDQA